MGLLLKVCVELGLEKRSKSQKTRYERERERERENGIDCFVSRDSSERRAVIKINRVFILV